MQKVKFSTLEPFLDFSTFFFFLFFVLFLLSLFLICPYLFFFLLSVFPSAFVFFFLSFLVLSFLCFFFLSCFLSFSSILSSILFLPSSFSLSFFRCFFFVSLSLCFLLFLSLGRAKLMTFQDPTHYNRGCNTMYPFSCSSGRVQCPGYVEHQHPAARTLRWPGPWRTLSRRRGLPHLRSGSDPGGSGARGQNSTSLWHAWGRWVQKRQGTSPGILWRVSNRRRYIIN